ncbi:MAG: C-terminal binding protein [Armatimonadetes bacterium]|nr:C-terminal binding protein [Armatimonadota bacterium]
MSKVIITDHYCFPSIEPEKRVLEPAGIAVREIDPYCKTEDDVVRNCMDADALLVLYAPITRYVLESLPRVKCLVRFGIGVNNFDLDACRDLGVTAANVPDYCVEEVSNHALAMILSLARRIPHDHSNIIQGKWDINQFRPMPALSDMTLGLVSFGKLARALARKVRPLGFRMIAFDPLAPDSLFEEAKVTRVDFETLLSESDVVSLHCPLVPETRHLINSEAISKMKNGAILVNTARGQVVNEVDLMDALKSGKLAGAGLDTFESEPLPSESPLRDLPNIILTSHSAWVSERAMELLQTKAAEAARDCLQGKRPASALVWPDDSHE